ncbi:hypothetical protein GCK72_026272 [Caenorhabditis remanei]|uniref:Uncharacterized protein n=1 Tax=Caenorhabditis remanei TaxID=31234 RepID=A0A6A5G4S0_CAERE|nr:hypothetical protein GCK72_026272 [Caenorhabditis remanei]KAF1749803.1 hypothetical protein GCK72_026272 [Caenorhabditis remanei]
MTPKTKKTDVPPNYPQSGYPYGNGYQKSYNGSGHQNNRPSQHRSFTDYGTGYVKKTVPGQKPYWEHNQSYQPNREVQRGGSNQQYPSTKYANPRYDYNKSFTAGMGETGKSNGNRDRFFTTESHYRSSGYKGFGNSKYRGEGRNIQIPTTGNSHDVSFTNFTTKSNNSRNTYNTSFTTTIGMGETGQPNARRDNLWTTKDDRPSAGNNGFVNPKYRGDGNHYQMQKGGNNKRYLSTKYAKSNFWTTDYNRHSSNSKGFENQKHSGNTNRNSYRYNPNTSYARYTGAKSGPKNVADHKTTIDFNFGRFESQQLNGDNFIQVFPSSFSTKLTDGQKLLQNLQNVESMGNPVGDSRMDQSFRGVQDESCQQDSSILAVGPVFTSPRPVKYPYMFSPAVEKILCAEKRKQKIDMEVANAKKTAKEKKDKLMMKQKIHSEDPLNMTITGGERFVESPPPSKAILNLTLGEDKLPRGILKKIHLARRSPPEFRSRSVSWGLVEAKSPDTPMYSPEGNLSDLNKSLMKPKSETSSEESTPSRPPKPLNIQPLKSAAKPKSLPPPGWKTSCPVTFKKVVEHNEDKNNAGCYMARGGICKFMPSVDITDGLATFVNPQTGRHIFMPLEFCFDLHPFIETGPDEIPAGRYYYLADPQNDLIGQWNRELREKHPELFNKPPHVSNHETGWDDLKAVVDEIAMKTRAPLPQAESPSMYHTSEKDDSSVQSSVTILKNTSDQKLAKLQEKKVEVSRKIILPPISKGVKRTPPRFCHVPVEDWLADTPAKTIDEKKMDQADFVDDTQPTTPKVSTQSVIFTPLQTSTPRKTSVHGSPSRTTALVRELQVTPKSWGNKNKLPSRRITVISNTLDDAELHNVKFLTPQSKKSSDDASSDTSESPFSPST